ncbi:MAG: G5 domain-containing protein [Chloroflexota bacterium]
MGRLSAFFRVFAVNISIRLASTVRRVYARRWVLLLLALVWGSSCQPQGGLVVVLVDGERLSVTVQEATVGEVLQRAGVTLGQLDRVFPDTWQLVRPGAEIVVTRMRHELIELQEELPFTRELVHNEALPFGEQRLAQKGETGQVRITYRVVYADDVEIEREEVRREILKQPVAEVVVVGSQGSLAAVPIAATVAYVSNGNAWVMRETSANRRPLTSWGDLDGRVFDLSMDGRFVLFTRAGGSEPDEPLNTLWAVATTVLGQQPFSLGVENTLYAQWSPDGQSIVYSTAEHTGGRPGWKAHNDLWLAPFSEQDEGNPVLGAPERLLPASDEGAFSWWGTHFAWSPDGRYIAYARADQIGVVDVSLKLPIRLVEFPEYNTYSDWVWVSALSWSPDSRFIVCTVHKPLAQQGVVDQDSPAFDLEVLAVDRSVHAVLVHDVGMWAGAKWSPRLKGADSRIVYGLAQQPFESEHSRYEVYMVDRDGSNAQRLFPPLGEIGLVAPPQMAWSPAGDQVLIVRGGNLYVLEVDSGLVRQLTGDGAAHLPCWQGS